MKTIPLSRGLLAFVSDKDFKKLSCHKWYALRSSPGVFYAARGTWDGIKNTTILMHREVLNLPPGRLPEVDHKNRNRLDNQRCNLRKATSHQNKGNAKKRCDGGNKFRGVSWSKLHKRWRADITGKNHKFLGCFDLDYLAAKAYDAAAIKYFGKFALLNFPKSSNQK